MDMTPNVAFVAVQAVPFLVTLFVLDKVIFKPMLGFLDDREKALVDGARRTADLQSQIEDRVATYARRLEQAREEIGTLRAQRRADAHEEYEKRLGAARAEAEAQVSEAVAKISHERQQAWVTLEASARQLAGEIAGRVLGRNTAVG